VVLVWTEYQTKKWQSQTIPNHKIPYTKIPIGALLPSHPISTQQTKSLANPSCSTHPPHFHLKPSNLSNSNNNDDGDDYPHRENAFKAAQVQGFYTNSAPPALYGSNRLSHIILKPSIQALPLHPTSPHLTFSFRARVSQHLKQRTRQSPSVSSTSHAYHASRSAEPQERNNDKENESRSNQMHVTRKAQSR
jgi:hypothetical protein